MSVEDQIAKFEAKSLKDTTKKAKKEKWEVGSEEYERYLKGNRNAKKAQELHAEFEKALQSEDLEEPAQAHHRPEYCLSCFRFQ